ncbi:endolytic transglycosylase MltG [Granulicella cerasi]|uniref:Endolytic murein transglycosylase n=1 Tax=Granulicella cerasi TaxID=741063 RepID=A0ABW1ZC39_9BACT|nr:endolytic transglycosylase MltG [Granulicella cerasi]
MGCAVDGSRCTIWAIYDQDVRWLGWIVVFVLVAVAGAGWLAVTPYGPSSETFVEIAPGTNTEGIGDALRKAGVIRSGVLFAALKKYRGGTLKAGEYRFDHPAPMTEVYARLRKGDVYTKTVVIPEGYDIFQVAKAVGDAGLLSEKEFLAAELQHPELVKRWNPMAASVEGYLFPDTYKFSRKATAVDMIAAMVKRFGQMAAKLGVEPRDAPRVVTMASLVEREVHIPSERAAVAGVFENRLALGMPLQTDPAVAYASELRGTWTGVIHQSELHSDSTYNTYTHAGLPPGPICNPGVAALQAAMHPLKSDYLYFVADARGNTTFARTLAEHTQNVAAYRAAGGK